MSFKIVFFYMFVLGQDPTMTQMYNDNYGCNFMSNQHLKPLRTPSYK